jgi:hypothetical protein
MDGDLSDARQLEVYEIGAWLLTRLAFPGETQFQERLSRVHASLCAYALRTKYETDGEWLVAPQPIKPIYALRPQWDIDRDLRTFERRLRDRMIAARMAIGFLKEAVTGEVPNLAGLARLSINQMHDWCSTTAVTTTPRMSRAGSGGRACRSSIWPPLFNFCCILLNPKRGGWDLKRCCSSARLSS